MTSSEIGAFWEANADTWTRQVRAGYDVYRDGLNTPAFLAFSSLPADELARSEPFRIPRSPNALWMDRRDPSGGFLNRKAL
jgi:hypothetical protein